MSDKPQEPLNGQQVQALQKQFAGELQKIVRDVDLRKYALDQACRFDAPDPIKLAQAMHDFLTAAADLPKP